MRRRLLAILAACLVSVVAWAVDTPASPRTDVPAKNATASPSQAEPSSSGLSCSSEMKVLNPLPLEQVQGIPKCPAQIPCTAVGRKCSESNCQTVELEFSSCRKPGGQIISCTNGNLLLTTCDCNQVFQQQCCGDTCDCTLCPNESQRTQCP